MEASIADISRLVEAQYKLQKQLDDKNREADNKIRYEKVDLLSALEGQIVVVKKRLKDEENMYEKIYADLRKKRQAMVDRIKELKLIDRYNKAYVKQLLKIKEVKKYLKKNGISKSEFIKSFKVVRYDEESGLFEYSTEWNSYIQHQFSDFISQLGVQWVMSTAEIESPVMMYYKIDGNDDRKFMRADHFLEAQKQNLELIDNEFLTEDQAESVMTYLNTIHNELTAIEVKVERKQRDVAKRYSPID